MLRLKGEGRRKLIRMRWSLLPGWWSKDLKAVPATFNAKAEKPMFRSAIKQRRCIVPASGFYESAGEKGSQVAHLFISADSSPGLGFAGL